MRPGCAAAAVSLIAGPQVARADDQTSTPQRPAIMFNRWQEDWSVLADPRVPCESFDEFKYIPLSGSNGVFGDPDARILRLDRRSKKWFVTVAGRSGTAGTLAACPARIGRRRSGKNWTIAPHHTPIASLIRAAVNGRSRSR
jgi:hypothetical protein